MTLTSTRVEAGDYLTVTADGRCWRIIRYRDREWGGGWAAYLFRGTPERAETLLQLNTLLDWEHWEYRAFASTKREALAGIEQVAGFNRPAESEPRLD